MDKNKRICCFCERWESGGIESFLFNVLTRMDLQHLEIDIVASSIGRSIFTKFLQKNGIHFIELSGSQRNILENHRKFRKLLRERKYDILHLNAFQGLSLSMYRKTRECSSSNCPQPQLGAEGEPISLVETDDSHLGQSEIYKRCYQFVDLLPDGIRVHV